MTLQEIEKLEQGDELTYTGKGFIRFDKNDRRMEFEQKDERGKFDIWVKYKGYTILVRVDEVERKKSL
jgi:hypothetical protein